MKISGRVIELDGNKLARAVDVYLGRLVQLCDWDPGQQRWILRGGAS